MARRISEKPAKRANKPNPREERNRSYHPLDNPRGQKSEEEISSKPRKRVELLPRNLAQETYVEALEDESKTIIFAMGPAGTGKSLLATLKAIQSYQRGEIEKIIVARPLVSVGDPIGFLPGDLQSKLAPWCVPILDIFKEYYSVQQVERMIKNEVIELGNIGMFRGRTVKNAYLIFDEAQNATCEQMKMMLTRLGENSRMFVNGDLRQHDRGHEANGFKDFVERLNRTGSEAIEVVRFNRGDVERHPIVEEVLRVYGDND